MKLRIMFNLTVGCPFGTSKHSDSFLISYYLYMLLSCISQLPQQMPKSNIGLNYCASDFRVYFTNG